MTFILHGHTLSSCLSYVVNATYILRISLIESANFMAFVWLGDDRNDCMSIFLLVYNQLTFD